MQHLFDLGWSHFFEQSFDAYREQGLSPARVTRIHKNTCGVYGENGEVTATLSGKFRHQAHTRSDWPAVGDWVAVELPAGAPQAVIHGILPRKSAFSRKVAGTVTEEQLVAANIDTCFIVSGLDRDFNPRRIERYLTLVWNSGANPVILLNKADLCPEIEARVAEVEAVAFGVPIHVLSATQQTGLEALRAYLAKGQTVALLGSSGVGKSTLINTLLGSGRQVVGVVRERDGRGRHITSMRELIFLPGGGAIIDNPGMREIQLWADERGLKTTFEEITGLAEHCQFRDCRHESEPGCAVQAALENGELDVQRYQSYLKQKKELHYLSRRQDKKAQLAEQAKWKKLSKWLKEKNKHKYR